MTSAAVQWTVLIPALVGVAASYLTELVTKSNAPQLVKSVAFLFLSTLGAVVATVIWAPGETWQQYALAVMSAVVAGIATHYTGATGFLQDATPTVGLGAPVQDDSTAGHG